MLLFWDALARGRSGLVTRRSQEIQVSVHCDSGDSCDKDGLQLSKDEYSLSNMMGIRPVECVL
jgi:hypothetical protein